jgi:CBS domain-containing protein
MQNQRARDLMVAPAISATEATTVAAMADLLMNHRIKRLPILRDGTLVGIVSRADLVHALARTPSAIAEAL